MRSLSLAATVAGTAVASCLMVGVLVLAALSVVESRKAEVLFLALVAVLALVVLLVLPLHVLPALAFAITVFVPDRVTDFSTSPVVVPATAVLVVWLLRRVLKGGLDPREVPDGPGSAGIRGLRVLTLVLGVILVPLCLIAPVKQFAVGWTFTFIVAVVGPFLVGRVDREAQALRSALPWLGSVAAAYTLLQSVLQANVVYTPVYDALGKPDVQHWAVYRSDGSFGHPLLAGMFFAIVLAFCTGRWLETDRRRYLVPVVLNGLAIVSTVSRGSYVAAGIAVAVLVVAMFSARRGRRLRLVALLAGFAGAAYLAVNTDAFVDRGLSGEALASANSRNALPQITFDTAQAYHWLGGGPASSSTISAPFNFQGLPIENSYLQLVMSVGAPGLLLFLAILVTAVVVAVQRRNFGALAGLVAYAIAISGFAALDSRRNLLVLLSVLIMLCISRFTPTGEAPEVEVEREPATVGVSGSRR